MITTQSGLGTAAGLGADIPLSSTLSLQIMPYLNMHGVLLTSHASYPQRVFDRGVRIALLVQR